MRRIFSIALVCLGALPVLQAQTMSHEEELVRNAYAKFTFLCALDTVANVAEKQEIGKSSPDPNYLNDRLDATVPVFTLTNFEAGPLADIASRPWKDFVTPQGSAAGVLGSTSSNRYYSENGHQVTWTGVSAFWTPVQTNISAELAMMDRPVSQVIAIASPYWSGKNNPVTYTSYVAYTVDVSMGGKTTGPHKAMYLFGTDSHGKPFVSEQDLISGTHISMSGLLATPTYPAGFLQSPLRDTPAAMTWIRKNEMPSSSCDATKRDVCCSHGHCGISQTDLNRDLAAPLFGSGGNQ
ncbi:MAG TPA: hypothetical protein VE178_04340 [Silvibacterium sp.]|jgi:hypothetical protein|nr:hypothetical protein [Silvibacterium sp.]